MICVPLVGRAVRDLRLIRRISVPVRFVGGRVP